MQDNEQQSTVRSFNPKEHMTQLKSKAGDQDYLPVQWRLVWFRTECPHGTIDTEEIEVNLDRVCESEAYVWNAEKRRSEKVIKQAKGYARFKATVTDGKGGRATGTGSECAADFADYAEKAETKSVGRALAALGYGTQFAPEFNEEHRIVDAPVDTSQQNGNDTPAQDDQQNNLQSQAEAPNGKQVAQPKPAQVPLNQRIDEAYTLCVEKGLVTPGPDKVKNAASFLAVCGKATGANITVLGHLTPTRMDTIEKYLTADQLAS